MDSKNDNPQEMTSIHIKMKNGTAIDKDLEENKENKMHTNNVGFANGHSANILPGVESKYTYLDTSKQ